MKHIIGTVCALALGTLLLVSPLRPHDKEDWPVPDEAKQKKNPMASNHESPMKAKPLYEKNCLMCHGETGKGDGMMAAMLSEKPPSFTDAHMMGEMSDGELFWKIGEGKAPMPSFKTKFSEEERWHLVNYIRAFSAHEHHGKHQHGSGHEEHKK